MHKEAALFGAASYVYILHEKYVLTFKRGLSTLLNPLSL